MLLESKTRVRIQNLINKLNLKQYDSKITSIISIENYNCIHSELIKFLTNYNPKN